MLFDLRSPHRRRVIKVVYVFLAVLIGGGLIFFGIGNGSNFGGLLTAAGGGGGTATGEKQYTKALASAEKAAKASPDKAALWLKVGEAAYTLATLSTNYDSSLGYTKSGHVALNQMRQAWTNYLALDPTNPNTLFAEEVAAAFGPSPSGVGDYKTAEVAQGIVAANEPTVSSYEYLAYYSWLAKDDTSGDLAAKKAKQLATKTTVSSVVTTLTEMATAAGATLPAGVTGPTGATGSTGTKGSAATKGSTGSTGAG
jgi:hypothetical protein